MKRQLERLKGKRLVTGDANLMTKNEICINTTSDGGVEVKEIGTDGKIKDLTSSGSSEEPDDLLTYLYYRCTPEIQNLVMEITDIYTFFAGCIAAAPLAKVSTTGTGLTRNSVIISPTTLGSGFGNPSINMIAIPKYIYLGDMDISGDFPDYISIIDYFVLSLEANGGDGEAFKNLMKSLETTREEFVNLDN